MAHAGLVEVLYNGSWGTVCSGVRDWDFSTPNALVVCRQLGFGPAIRLVLVVTGVDWTLNDWALQQLNLWQ